MEKKNHAHPSTPSADKSADASLLHGCKLSLRVTIIYSWGDLPSLGGSTCTMEVLFPPSCRAAERDVSLREWRGDRRAGETTQAKLTSPDRVQFKSAELCIPATATITGWLVSVAYVHFLSQSICGLLAYRGLAVDADGWSANAK